MSARQISRDRLDLIMRLEEIISCCNAHMQQGGDNALARGKTPSAFPATFHKAGRQAQSWSVLTGGEIEASVIMNGVYKFGASQIPVYQNLNDLLEYLETHYGLQVPK